MFDDFVDLNWCPIDKQQIIDYLRDMPYGIMGLKPYRCNMCGKYLDEGYRNDGDWVWPTRLYHYVEEHNIRLPDTFVSHIRGLGYTIPELTAPPTNLQWPKITCTQTAASTQEEELPDRRKWSVFVHDDNQKLLVAKLLRKLFSLSLTEAKATVDKMPNVIFTGNKDDSDKLCQMLKNENIKYSLTVDE